MGPRFRFSRIFLVILCPQASFIRSPFFFRAVYTVSCVSVSVSLICLNIWCNGLLTLSNNIRIHFARSFTFLKHLFNEIRWDFAVMRINFLMFLCSEPAIGVQQLKDTGIIRSNVLCNSSGRDMTCCADPSAIDGFRWRCRRRVAGTRCSLSEVHKARLLVPEE
jgi:hypothetical protein